MKTYIALIRGINVGGHKRVPMAGLRALLSKEGLENVQTYIQSGNVIFQSSEENKEKLESKIHNAIKNQFGFEVPILIKTTEELQQIFDDCPFPEEKKINSYFTMLHDMPSEDLVKMASEKVYEGEEYQIIKGCIYFYYEKGYGASQIQYEFLRTKIKNDSYGKKL